MYPGSWHNVFLLVWGTCDSHVPSCFFSPTSTCPLSCALWPHDASLFWQAFHSLAQLLGVCTEIPCMCQLLLQQTQNRWLTATCMWACRTKMCAGEWQDHPVPEVKHKGDETTCVEAVSQLFYGVHQSFTLHYKEHSCLLKVTRAGTLACLKQHKFSSAVIRRAVFALLYFLYSPFGMHLQLTCDCMVWKPAGDKDTCSTVALWCFGLGSAFRGQLKSNVEVFQYKAGQSCSCDVWAWPLLF